ncbi:phasin [Chenggangzhangella methanolivorans]|uniref:Phasin n=1 Tax=Chenggangzhangella methanolivorans TaxID=1437009 RepID=A0A9E6RDN4_9HYPH|nr:phasin [Chenggangzhangella methanolivorans]QZN99180.1 phasin [Chenggangzhangella methanolivorans]
MATTAPKTAAAKSDEAVEETLATASKIAADVPAPVRELAEKSVQQAKDGYARWKAAAEETSDAFEDALATSSKGYKEFSRKSVELTRSNVNAHFDFLQALIGAKSVSQAIELQTSFARQQFEVLSGQAKELSSLAQKAATDGTKPFQDLASKTARFAQSQ